MKFIAMVSEIIDKLNPFTLTCAFALIIALLFAAVEWLSKDRRA